MLTGKVFQYFNEISSLSPNDLPKDLTAVNDGTAVKGSETTNTGTTETGTLDGDGGDLDKEEQLHTQKEVQ